MDKHATDNDERVVIATMKAMDSGSFGDGKSCDGDDDEDKDEYIQQVKQGMKMSGIDTEMEL